MATSSRSFKTGSGMTGGKTRRTRLASHARRASGMIPRMSRRASLSLILTLGFLTAAAKPTPPAASQPAADEAPPIFETKLAKPQQIINLPAPADQVIPAGGGRYLIFRCKR